MKRPQMIGYARRDARGPHISIVFMKLFECPRCRVLHTYFINRNGGTACYLCDEALADSDRALAWLEEQRKAEP